MKKYLLLLLLGCNVFAADFVLEEKAFTIGTDLEISNGGGTIEERTISIGRTFEIVGKYACKSETKVFTTGTTYKLTIDGNVSYIIEKQVVKSAFTFLGNVFIIKNALGNEIAKSELTKGWRPSFAVTESNGASSTLRVSGIKYYTWNIHQDNNSKLDPRVLFIIAASKTAGDNDKSNETTSRR